MAAIHWQSMMLMQNNVSLLDGVEMKDDDGDDGFLLLLHQIAKKILIAII